MASPPPMQREAVRRPVIAVRTIRPVGALALLRRLLMRLAAGDEGRQALDILVACWLEVLLRARLNVLRMHVLRLNVRLLLLLARVKRLRLARRERLAAKRGLLAVALVVTVAGNIAVLFATLLVIGLALAKLLLRGRDQAEIVLSVLIIVFGRNRVAGTLRVTRKLEIFLGDVRRRSPNFHVRSIGLVHA